MRSLVVLVACDDAWAAAGLQVHDGTVFEDHVVACGPCEHRRHGSRVREQHAAAAVPVQPAHRAHGLDRRLAAADARVVLPPSCDRIAREASDWG